MRSYILGDLPNFKNYLYESQDLSYGIEMPGVERSSISAKLKGNTLTILWTSRFGEGKNWSTTLSQDLDFDHLTLSFNNGLLIVNCPVRGTLPPEEPEINIEIK